MTEPVVLVAHKDKIATVTINRPDARNALNEAVLHALRDAIAELARVAPRCVIVTGAGQAAFVSGADIAAMSHMTPLEAHAFARRGQQTFSALEALPCPVIAAVNGFALGGGCELALACDFICASDKLKIGQPEVTLGILPGFGGTQRLARRIGSGRARELIFTGRRLGAEEALRIGLVDRVFAHHELMDGALEIARAIASRSSPAAVAAAKRVLNLSADAGLAAGLELEAQTFGACFAHPDQREGMAAFLEKRTPAFRDLSD